jgi:hypothetical protein
MWNYLKTFNLKSKDRENRCEQNQKMSITDAQSFWNLLHAIIIPVLQCADFCSDGLVVLQLILTVGTLFVSNPTAGYRRIKAVTTSPASSLLPLSIVIYLLTILISTVPHIPWLNFICHVLAYVAEIQLILLWWGISPLDERDRVYDEVMIQVRGEDGN